jgi:mannan endo-1,4-beta-mannosidase
MRLLAIVAAVITAAAGFLAVVLIRDAGPTQPQAASPHATPLSLQVKTPQATARKLSLGIISYNLPTFEKSTKIRPSITAKYFNWGAPFPSAQIKAYHKLGATTLVVLEPRTQNMSKLAGGKYDSYLKKWALADKKLNLPIIFSFAPEANGNWYPWGKGHITPALYRKMFQHVHNVLLKDGARHVTWLWQADRSSPRTEALKPLFPGKAYVNEIGLDGQLSQSFPTFKVVFGSTLTEVRAFSKLPIMLSEVGVERGATAPKKIRDLFGSARQKSLSALVLFDVGNWFFDNNPAALEEIRTEAAAKN